MPEALDWRTELARLAQSRPIFHSEADFQHALAWEVHLEHPSLSVRLEYKPYPAERFYVDLWLRGAAGATAVELKYLTRGLKVLVGGEQFVLADQAAQDISRYDVIKDVTRVERLVSDGLVASGTVIVLTNDSAYWKQSERVTVDQAFRLAEGGVLAGNLAWSPSAGAGTTKGREAVLGLRGSYPIHWTDCSIVDPSHPYGRIRCLIFEVGR